MHQYRKLYLFTKRHLLEILLIVIYTTILALGIPTQKIFAWTNPLSDCVYYHPQTNPVIVYELFRNHEGNSTEPYDLDGDTSWAIVKGSTNTSTSAWFLYYNNYNDLYFQNVGGNLSLNVPNQTRRMSINYNGSSTPVIDPQSSANISTLSCFNSTRNVNYPTNWGENQVYQSYDDEPEPTEPTEPTPTPSNEPNFGQKVGILTSFVIGGYIIWLLRFREPRA